MDDNKITELFFARSEDAILELGKKYGRYARYIALGILENREDADEIVNDTYLRIWNSVPPTRPDNLKAYVATVTRSLALDRIDRNNALKRKENVLYILDELSECIGSGGADEVNASIDLSALLNRFIHSLSERKQKVFLMRYWYMRTDIEIAKETGLSTGSVRSILSRTRKKLREILKEEGFDV